MDQVKKLAWSGVRRLVPAQGPRGKSILSHEELYRRIDYSTRYSLA